MAFIKFQRTIATQTSCIGVGLHTGVESKITFKPAPENFGIRFKRMDIKDGIEIRADIDHVVDISRGTTIEENGVRIHTVEHILDHGTEHDLQMKYLRENNIDDLKIYLMETVDYNL